MKELKEEIDRKLKYVNKRLEEKKKFEKEVGINNLTYHGGRSMGYLEGQLSVLEDLEILVNEKINLTNNKN
jgi:hypothetical protein